MLYPIIKNLNKRDQLLCDNIACLVNKIKNNSWFSFLIIDSLKNTIHVNNGKYC